MFCGIIRKLKADVIVCLPALWKIQQAQNGDNYTACSRTMILTAFRLCHSPLFKLDPSHEFKICFGKTKAKGIMDWLSIRELKDPTRL